MTAEYQVHGAVAVITLNNPPVNGLGLATRTAAVQGIQQALADAAVKAIVITEPAKPSRAAPTSRNSIRPRHWPSPACIP
jgi:3-hydroxyacyl-CoA dehydrogenase